MANWLYVIDIKHLKEKFTEDTDTKAFAEGIVPILDEFIEKAKKHVLLDEETWEEEILWNLKTIRDAIRDVSEQTECENWEVNDQLNELFDWADETVYFESIRGKTMILGKTCWINHMFDYTPEKLDKEVTQRNGYTPAHLEVTQ